MVDIKVKLNRIYMCTFYIRRVALYIASSFETAAS